MNVNHRTLSGIAGLMAGLLLICAQATAQIPEHFYFQLNEGTGSTTLDLAVPGHGVTMPSMTSGWDTTAPMLGAACMQDAAPSAGQLNTNSAWSTGGGDFTIELWQYDTTGNFQYIYGDSTASSFRCFISGSSGTASLTGGGLSLCQLTSSVAPGTWTHMAWTYEAATGTMLGYVNGVLNVTTNQPANLTISGSSFNVGGYILGNADVEGKIDEFRVWGQVRSAADINNFMNVELGAGGFADDLACLSVNSPSDAAVCTALSASESVSFGVINFGTNTINIGSSFSAELFVNGTSVVTENFTFLTTNHPLYSSEIFTFATTLDMSLGGVFNIDVTVNLPGDQDNSNDTKSRTVDAGSLVDLEATSIDGPGDAVGCNILSTTETVSFTVTNRGANDVLIGTSFAATLSLNGTALATENFTVVSGNIACGATDSFAFATTADLSAGGVQNLDIAIVLAGDVQPANDTAALAVNATGPGGIGGFINTFPYFEDFDTFGGAGNGVTTPVNNGWLQDPNDSSGSNGDWYFGTGTSSSNSGPETNGLGDHTSGSGRFGYVEDSSSANPVINLWSPCIDLTGLTNPAMRIWVNAHDYNGTNTYFNPVHVDLLTPGGVVTSAGSIVADTGDQWVSVTISLVPYIGQIVQAQIRSTNAGSSSFYCDSSIDDFSVFEQMILNGQAPQAGIATLDINSAANANTNGVVSGDNGPYTTNIASGGTMTFSMTGEAFAGILLVGGPLNVQVATYPGFGQFDIGTLPLNGAGIPGGLVQWADGITAPVLGLNQFFALNGTGASTVSIGLPILPVGTLTTFQAINTHSTQIVGFSNAVEVVIF